MSKLSRKERADGIGRFVKGRSKKAATILAEYYKPDELYASTVDMLIDLMHLSKREGFSFENALFDARYHYRVERIVKI